MQWLDVHNGSNGPQGIFMRIAIDLFRRTAAMNCVTRAMPKYKLCMRLTKNLMIDALLCHDIHPLNDA